MSCETTSWRLAESFFLTQDNPDTLRQIGTSGVRLFVEGKALQIPRAFMRTARQVCLAFLILFIAAARATGWPADYPQVRGIFPNADAYGEFEGTPPSAAIYQSGQLIGYVYLTSDVLRIPAYSGKPITTLVGIDTIGRIAGLAVVQHDEPILAVGISQERLARYVDQYAGKSVFDDVVIGARRDGHVAIDGISGATITVMVSRKSNAQTLSLWASGTP